MKKYILSAVVLILTSFFSLSAQTYNWKSSIGSTSSGETYKDVAVDAAGNTYVVGNYTLGMTMPISPLSVTNSGPKEDVILAKYNSSGIMQWHQKIGTNGGTESATSIAVNSSGDVYISGIFDGNSVYTRLVGGAIGIGTAGGSDMFLVKYNTTGTCMWAVSVGGTGTDESKDLALDASGNPCIVGLIQTDPVNVYSSATSSPHLNHVLLGTLPSSTSNGSFDIAFIKFDPSGNYISSSVMGSTGSDIPSVLKFDALGNYYIAGVFGQTVDLDPGIGVTNVTELTPQGSGDAFLAKYTSTGAFLWGGAIQGVSEESIKDVGIDAAGNVYVVGSFQGFVNFDLLGGTQTLTSAGLRDIFIAKYNASTGAFISVSKIGGTGEDEANGIHVVPSGDFYMTGYFSGAAVDFDPSVATKSLTSTGASDAFLAKYNSSVVNTWAFSMGGAAADPATPSSYNLPDIGNKINLTSNGDIVWCGNFTGAADVDPGVGTANLTAIGGQDMFLVSYLESCIGAAITTQPVVTQTLCSGVTASFNVVATGTAVTYQWKKEGTALVDGGTISGSGSATLAISSVVAGDAGTYTVDVIGCAGTVVSSNSVLTINTAAAITTQPVATQSLCSSAPASFTVAASGSGLTYQWRKGGTALVNGGTISGVGTATLNISSIVSGDAGTYTVDVIGCAGTIVSANAVLSVNTAAAITTQPIFSQAICIGAPASFLVAASGTGLTYQWKKGGTALVDGGTISGSGSATLAISSVVAGDAGTYTVDVIGCAGTVVSTNSVLTVKSPASIVIQPVTTQTLCTASAAAFNVTASGGGLTYQWRKGGTALVNGGTISGVSTATLNISSIVSGDAGTYTVDVIGCAGTVVSTNSVLSVNTAAAITTQPIASQSLCTGAPASITVAATGTGLAYQWNLNGTPLVDGGTISGSGTATLAISSVLAGDAGTYTVDVIGCAGTLVSTNSVLTVKSPASIVIQPVTTQTLCTASAAAFNVTASGGGLTYQWRKGGTALVNGGTISGVSTATLNISSIVSGDAGTYTVDVIGCAGTVVSTNSVLSVNTAAAITTQPIASQSLCTGAPASITVAATGTGLTYQWNLNGTPLVDGGTISGSGTSTLDISAVAVGDAGNYTCDITAAGCGAAITTTTSALVVNSSAVITTEPIATQILCTGNAFNLDVVATGTGLTYQWKLNGTPLADGGTITGSATANLAISSLVAGDAGTYTVDVIGCSGTVPSANADLTVNIGAAITTQPIVTQTKCSGDAASITVAATGTGLTYQWNLNGTPLVDGGTISGSGTSTLDISAVAVGDAGNYTCDITAAGCGAAITTTASALVVNSSAVITTQPITTITLCTGNAFNLDVVATGTGLTYQWNLNGTPLADGGTITGSATANLAISSLVAGDDGTYTVDVIGCSGTVTSANALLTVNVGAAITTQPIVTQSYCTGEAASITVAATGTGLAYQWNLNGTPLVDGGTISGSGTSTLDISAVAVGDAGNYTCDITAAGCGAAITTTASALVVNSSVVITTQPITTTTLCTGNSFNLDVVATGTGLTYQWNLNGTPLADGGTITGSATANLAISSLVAGDDGTYTVDVIGCSGTVTSANALLTVNVGATITTQPIVTQSHCTGEGASITVATTGTGLAYQWNLNGTPLVDGGTISGSGTSTLDISAVAVGDAGNYTCDITATGCGAAITTTASALVVNSSAVITTQPITTTTLCTGNAFNLGVVATGTGLTYQWNLNGTPLADGGTITGSSTANLAISSLVAGDDGNYTCTVSSSTCGAPVTSVVSLLNVTSGSASIDTQPTDVIACTGTPVTFDLIASGAGLGYQWKKNGVAMVDGGNVSGSMTSSLVLTAAVLSDAAIYTCEVTTTCGIPVVTNNAVLTVNPSTVVFTTQPFSAVVCLNQQASFKVVAVGGLTYQWQYKPTGGVYADITDGGSIFGTSTSTLVINNSQFVNRGNYRCIVASGACSGGTASAAASLSFETPMIVSEPLSQSLCTSQGVTFNVVALGNNLSYQWFKSGSLMGNVPYKIVGATKSTMQIFDINAADEATYYCVVQGLCPPPAFSDNVSLFVNICTGVEETQASSAFSVYPNPSEGVFSLKLNASTTSALSYDVFSTLGEIIYSDKISNAGTVSNINLKNQAAGMYLLRVNIGEEQVWERLIIEK